MFNDKTERDEKASEGQVTDTSCDDVRGAFEDEHPRNMVDACNAYALSVFPFGREDERPDGYESEIWETGMMVGSGFKVNGSRLMVQGSRPFLPCVINQMKVADGWGDGGEEG